MRATTEDLERLRQEALAGLAAVADEAALEEWRLQYLSRSRGRIEAAVGAIRSLPPAERRGYGQAVNALKREVTAAYEAKRDALARRRLEEAVTRGRVDVTLPGRRKRVGRLHPTTQTLRAIIAAFAELGFTVEIGRASCRERV